MIAVLDDPVAVARPAAWASPRAAVPRRLQIIPGPDRASLIRRDKDALRRRFRSLLKRAFEQRHVAQIVAVDRDRVECVDLGIVRVAFVSNQSAGPIDHRHR